MKRNADLIKNSKGFTLIEVLVAVTILGISLIYIFSTFNSQLIQFKYSKERLLATSLACQLAEDLEAHFDDAKEEGSTRVSAFKNNLETNYHYGLVFHVEDISADLKKISIEIDKMSRKLVKLEYLINRQ